jgi:hypothetical protein
LQKKQIYALLILKVVFAKHDSIFIPYIILINLMDQPNKDFTKYTNFFAIQVSFIKNEQQPKLLSNNNFTLT